MPSSTSSLSSTDRPGSAVARLLLATLLGCRHRQAVDGGAGAGLGAYARLMTRRHVGRLAWKVPPKPTHRDHRAIRAVVHTDSPARARARARVTCTRVLGRCVIRFWRIGQRRDVSMAGHQQSHPRYVDAPAARRA